MSQPRTNAGDLGLKFTDKTVLWLILCATGANVGVGGISTSAQDKIADELREIRIQMAIGAEKDKEAEKRVERIEVDFGRRLQNLETLFLRDATK